MKTIVVVKQLFRNIKNQMLLIENLCSDLNLEVDKEYYLELKEAKNPRTIQQNKFMWSLIREIADYENDTEINVYCSLLEESNAKYEYVMGLESIEDELRKNFRAVKVVRPEEYKGKKMIVYKCFIGSSKMNTKEMTTLLENTIQRAENNGIYVNEEYLTN